MATLNEIARNYADEIRDGIAWVLIWKTGRSWNATAVWLNAETDTFEPDDLDTAREVLKQDPNAVMLNGYYCGHFGEDITVKEIAAGIRWHYEGGYNTLDGSTAFPPEPTERPADLPADMAWRDVPAAEEPDPYVYDGHMSPEDYELMHKNREALDPYTYDVKAFGETWRVLATANRYAANKTLAVSLTTEEGEPLRRHHRQHRRQRLQRRQPHGLPRREQLPLGGGVPPGDRPREADRDPRPLRLLYLPALHVRHDEDEARPVTA